MSRALDYSSAEDGALVRAAKRGDRNAFEELVARHRDKVYSRAYSIVRNEDNALDVSQDAWVRAWQRLNQFNEESKFSTWVTRIAINCSLDALRRQKRTTTESIEALDDEVGGVERYLPIDIPEPTRELERAELRERIDEGLAQLSPEHRTALVLVEFEELGYREIARRMKCSVGTVMSRIYYARRKLASLLADLKTRNKE